MSLRPTHPPHDQRERHGDGEQRRPGEKLGPRECDHVVGVNLVSHGDSVACRPRMSSAGPLYLSAVRRAVKPEPLLAIAPKFHV